MAVSWKDIDWDLLKVEYELFGRTFEEIAVETGVPVGHLRDVAGEQGWLMHPLAQEMVVKDTASLVKQAEDYEVYVEEKLKRLKLIKAEMLAPLYSKIEVVLLTKAVALASAIDKASPTASKELKDIASVMQTVMQANGMMAQSNDKGDGNKMVVVIQNKVGEAAKQEDNECIVEVRPIDNGKSAI